jgi:ribosomal-protein-alanine acetyltransferase
MTLTRKGGGVMDIIFREATANDAAALLLHQNKVGDETDNLSFDGSTFKISPDKEARFIERFSKNEKDIMLVALDGGVIVGNGIIETERAKRYSHRATLSITVLRDYWGQGIGSRLMQMMIDFSKEQGIAVISLEVRADNERAVALYKKFGFEVIGLYKRFFKINGDYHDAYLMQLLL